MSHQIVICLVCQAQRSTRYLLLWTCPPWDRSHMTRYGHAHRIISGAGTLPPDCCTVRTQRATITFPLPTILPPPCYLFPLCNEFVVYPRCPPDQLNTGRPRTIAEWREIRVPVRSVRSGRTYCWRVVDEWPSLRYMTGQISASLSAMHRTVEDYDSMAKREIIKAKQEKAMMYVLSS